METAAVCKQCGTEFTPTNKRGKKPGYCSTGCRQKAWRLRTGRYRMAHGKLCPYCREGFVPANDPYDGYCCVQCQEKARQWASQGANCPTCSAEWIGQSVCSECGYPFHQHFLM